MIASNARSVSSGEVHTAIRNELAERELLAPSAWVRGAFGDAPGGPWARELWESDRRHVARYRVEYDITDPSDALGPPPEQREQGHDWERARRAIERGEQRLGRDVASQRDIDVEIGF